MMTYRQTIRSVFENGIERRSFRRTHKGCFVSLPGSRCTLDKRCEPSSPVFAALSSKLNQSHRSVLCHSSSTQPSFAELLRDADVKDLAVRMQPGQYGHGLYFTRKVAPGDVVLSVPLSRCLLVDYNAGLQVPAGSWPRLQRGVQKDASLPWDVLLALALLDALAGAGDSFWEQYASAVLPAPAALTLPLCLPAQSPDLLRELQHGSIQEAAVVQKERLGGIFPGLAGRMCEGGPTWLEWGFGCVRSRAFRLSPDCFAFVPFLDVADHSAEPSCDFRLASGSGSGGVGDGEGEARVELVAVRGGAEGEEATISHTGAEGMTNQRLMAQYGFVPPHGNPADRLAFSLLSPPSASASPAAAGPPAPPPSQTLLSIDRLQACLGDGQAMAAAFSGRDPYLYAALKSLPLAVDEGDAASWQDQADLARALLAELEAEREGWATTPSRDQALLEKAGEEGKAEGGTLDVRLAAAVQYRLQRKLLVGAASGLLRRFVEGGQ